VRKENERPETLTSPKRPGSPPPELLAEKIKWEPPAAYGTSVPSRLARDLDAIFSEERGFANQVAHLRLLPILKSLWIPADVPLS